MNSTQIDKMMNFHLPEYSEIPNVGLYLKQVVKYINDTVGETFGINVTNSMLSNYVKMHMVENPVKKLYYRDHIVVLLFIAMAKCVLSLENIDELLKHQQEHHETVRAYNYFKSNFEQSLKSVFGEDSVIMTDKNLPEDQKLLLKIVTAMSYKFYLDASFL